MKYKVGDKTLLGEIQSGRGEGVNHTYYLTSGYYFKEEDVDKIIIKPKRNIDHIIELWESGKTGEALEFFRDCSKFFHMYEDLTEVMLPYTEPSKCPNLTPDELKAVKLAIECGFRFLARNAQGYFLLSVCENGGTTAMAHTIPFLATFVNKEWVTPEPIDLNELLDAQEVGM